MQKVPIALLEALKGFFYVLLAITLFWWLVVGFIPVRECWLQEPQPPLFECIVKFDFDSIASTLGALLSLVGAAITWFGARIAKASASALDQGYEPGETQIKVARNRLLNDFNNIWINGVLRSSLEHVEYIRLDLVECPNVADTIATDVALPRRTLDTNKEISDLLDDAHGLLLLLGEPGAGKTTTQLQLASALSARVACDDTRPVPVIFKLASWSGMEKSFDEWLYKLFSDQFRLTPSITEYLLRYSKVSLILDGLDEVSADKRSSCVKALNAFRARRDIDITISSRKTEYTAIDDKLEMWACVELQPLSPRQVALYLDSANLDSKGLRQLLDKSPSLQPLVSVPLFLNIMLVAHQQLDTDDVALKTGVELQRAILDAFVVWQLDHCAKNAAPVSPLTTISSLKWMAAQMSKFGYYAFSVDIVGRRWLRDRRVDSVKFPLFAFLPLLLVIVALGINLSLSAENSWNQPANDTIAILLTAAVLLLMFFATAMLRQKASASESGKSAGHFWSSETDQLTRRLRYAAVILWTLMLGLAGANLIQWFSDRATPWNIAAVTVYVLITPVLLWYSYFRGLWVQYLLFRNGHLPWRYKQFLEHCVNLKLLRYLGVGYAFTHPLLHKHFAEIDPLRLFPEGKYPDCGG